MVKYTDGLMQKSTILKVLYQREGPTFNIESETIAQKIDHIIAKASIHKKWSVVRQCAAVLGKLVDSLAPSITSILVRGKHVSNEL